jgi:outer membrane protein
MQRKLTLFTMIFLLVLANTTATAQQDYRLTVQQAVELALKNAIDLKNLRLDSLKQKALNRQVTGLALPQVSATAQGAHYLTLPKVLFPSTGESSIYEVLNREGVKDASGNLIQPRFDFKVQEFSFVQPWSVSSGIGMNQLLFQPEVFVGLLARNTLMDFAGNNITVAEDKVREQVEKAYYQVLIAQKQHLVIQQTIQRIEKLYADQEQLYKNGFIERLDLDKTTVTLNNTRSAETQLKNVIQLGLAALKFSMGINQSENITLTDELTDDLVKEQLPDDEKVDYTKRNEYKLLQTAQKLGAIDVRRYKLGAFPTLAFFYQFQQQGQQNKDFSAFTGKNWFWFNSNLIGLSMNVTLFDGMQRKNKMLQAQYELEKTRNKTTQFQQAVDLEFTVAKTNLKNAILNMDAQKKNMELAEKVFLTARKKYEQGLGSTFEVLLTDTEWQRAQGSYFESLYNAVQARINYRKATGRLAEH